MKYLLLLIFYFLSVLEIQSQSLSGIWEGYFIVGTNKKDTIIMHLDFRSLADGSYEVYNFTKKNDFKSVCKMSYKTGRFNSIYLEEIEVIKINKPTNVIILQKMKLNLSKDNKSLSGKWSYADPVYKGGGKIFFRKKE